MLGVKSANVIARSVVVDELDERMYFCMVAYWVSAHVIRAKESDEFCY